MPIVHFEVFCWNTTNGSIMQSFPFSICVVAVVFLRTTNTLCHVICDLVQLWDNLNIWAAVHGGRGKGRFLRWFHARAPFADHTTSLSLSCKQSDLFLRPYITRGRGMTCFSRNIFCDLSQNLRSSHCFFLPLTITLPRPLKYFADPSIIDHSTHQSGSLTIHVVHCTLFHEPLGNV